MKPKWNELNLINLTVYYVIVYENAVLYRSPHIYNKKKKFTFSFIDWIIGLLKINLNYNWYF